ncbi:type II toxin-antitoxin system VapC family toxin [uncultured Alsobacter sp.]|uniref:type II toxin-antitoxin system VapC family toxin n=1 Tax=uncultured Alsobacter sp. TaxID=1748258 RepID=UPI00345C9FC6
MPPVLVDTHILLDVFGGKLSIKRPHLVPYLLSPSVQTVVSVLSFWEIAIKTRLGKLDPGLPLEVMEEVAVAAGLRILPVELRHVIATVSPEPATRDPFDRLLLAICQADGMRLATVDRALVSHPLALDTKGAIA